MRIMRWSALLSAALFATVAAAASSAVHSEIALTRAEIQTDRQAIVADNLPLTEEQAKAFWPLYRSYRGELATLGDKTVRLIEKYADTYDTLTDVQGQEMVDEFFAIQKEELKIRTAWVPKFAKVLPGKLVARFVQIENKLDAVIRLELAAEIPLVQHGVAKPKP